MKLICDYKAATLSRLRSKKSGNGDDIVQTRDELILITRLYQDTCQINDLGSSSLLHKISAGYLSLSDEEQVKYQTWLAKQIYEFNFPGTSYPSYGAVMGSIAGPMIAAYFVGPGTIVRNAISCSIGLFAGAYTAQQFKRAQQLYHLSQSPHATKNFAALVFIDRELGFGICSTHEMNDIDLAYYNFRRHSVSQTQNSTPSIGHVHTF